MRLGVRQALVGGRLVDGDVEIAGDRITAVGRSPRGRGGIAVPGLVDLQVNGYGGVDFLTDGPEAYASAGAALARSGVTAYQPTFITAPADALAEAAAGAGAAIAAGDTGARILGVHLEGPFLSPLRAGIHPAADMRAPDSKLLESLLDAGPVSMVTIAPELPGAIELIRLLRRRGIAASCGHTDATAEEARAAFDAGASAVTHLFNAMRPLHHRDPGVAAAALLRDDVTVQIILDGRHVAPEIAQIAWRLAGSRLCLVTDAIAAAGAGDGDYRVGPARVEVRGGRARLADGTLAGGVGTLLDCVRNLRSAGASFEQAVAAATAVPARLLGRRDVGALAVGGRADVTVLDERMDVVRVLVGGAEAG